MTILKVLENIGLGNPFKGFSDKGIPVDTQGFGSDHPYFHTLIDMSNPNLIIEVGTWKGASAINMARHALKANPNAMVICVDTWLGDESFWKISSEYHKDLRLENGYPTIYRQFLANVLRAKLENNIRPLPLASIPAARLLNEIGVKAELIYIDAAHDEYSAYGDIIHYWPLVKPNGILFGDDYWTTWPGVIKAVNRFAHENGLGLETSQGKWWFRKPAA